MNSLLLALLLLAPQGPSEKDVFDEVMTAVRAGQAADGSYGAGLTDTAAAVVAFALSPRAYRVDDGPFFRDAVTWLLSHQADAKELTDEAWLALALERAHAHLYLPSVQSILERRGWRSPDLPKMLLTEGGASSALEVLLAIPADATHSVRIQAAAQAALLRSRAATRAAARPDATASYERGVDALLALRGPSGFWEVFDAPEPGISAIATRALLGSQRAEARAAAEPVLDWLASLQKPDGSIHAGHVQVYTTSAAIGALLAAKRPQDQPVIDKAVAFLIATQCDEGEGYSEADKFYGGIGYGGDLRPDLSNLQYALEALHAAGVAADDPAFARAVLFLQRSQNRSESNTDVYLDADDPRPIRAGNDGGAAYYPGNSVAGVETLADGTRVARSYGSMTYALLKCYAFAGMDAKDPRVAAAVNWISSHWTLEVNPGFDMLKDARAGFQGLYYYYETLAEALAALNIDEIVAPGGERHDWRTELITTLQAAQREDGSWVNEFAPRWWEGNPALCTGYALNALLAARPNAAAR